MQIHREKTEVRAGANRLRIALPALHEIEVVGVAGQAWIQSRAREGPRYLRTFKGSADGRATIDGLPAGNYSVRCGSKSTNFTLPGATTVRLE